MDSYLFFVTILVTFTVVYTDDIHCGGFIKSDFPIQYSKVEIKLFTPEGILKYQTECAPNNGYFMVPFVDKEKFQLKVVPPSGWSFEPTSIDIDVNGKDDKCTLGEDINFKFTGFSVSGQVLDFNSNSHGPSGVELSLVAEGKVVSETKSEEGGMFTFSQVMPGKYSIDAKHKSLSFKKSKVQVLVENDNVECNEAVKVSGYDIQGRVSAKELPVKGVHLMLLTPTQQKNVAIPGCNTISPKGASSVLAGHKGTFMCSVMSDENGRFLFSSLQPGDYTIVPYHKGEHIKFDMEPHEMAFTIGKGIAKLPSEFHVTGFSVTGAVLGDKNGKPITGVEVFVNGKSQATTAADGTYQLQHMNSQKYSLVAKKDGYIFDKLEVSLGPDTPRLPDFIASAFTACGSVDINDKPSADFKPEQVAVKLNGPKDFKSKIVKISNDGKFCFEVPNGKYDLQMWVPMNLQSAGLIFTPSNLEFTVASAPVENLKFSQLTGSVTVNVKCIGACSDVVTVTLSNAEYKRNKNKMTAASKSNDTQAVFSHILPGTYEVKTVHPHWCWSHTVSPIEITKSQLTAEDTFAQTGFQLTCSISHDVNMLISHNKDKGENFELKKGKNTLCLKKEGRYTLNPKSCHKFDPQEVVYDTTKPKLITMQAVSHLVYVAVETTKKADDIRISVKSTSKGKETTGTLKYKKDFQTDGKTTYLYTMDYWGADKEKITLSPSSDILLFDHKVQHAIVYASECEKEVFRFQAFPGKFIEGRVVPSLKNVEIHLTDVDTEELVKLKTDKDGKYKLGPLHPQTSHTISAYMDGYVLKPDPNNPNDFMARKLSSIDFQVMGDKNIPLSGVLIAVSGGSYRSNNVTDNDGKLKLDKLEPGDYYFKVIMKEYQFEPPSSLISVKEGEDLTVAVAGKRVAFSCYGSVTSLNGQPERNVKLQAYGTGECGNRMEEGETNVDGEYRLKGLLPHCTYNVKVKESDIIESTSPRVMSVQATGDVTDVNFVALRAVTTFHISGNIVTDYKFLPQIKILLYDVSDLNSPVETQTLSDSFFFYLSPLQRADKEYQIRVETTLDSSRYSYVLPAASFYANGVHKHITLKFNPELIPIEAEMPQGSLITLPLTILLILAVYYHAEVMAFLQKVAGQYVGQVTNGGRGDTNATPTPHTKARGRARKDRS